MNFLLPQFRGFCVSVVLFLLLASTSAFALPAKPTRYVNDYANVLSPGTESTLENRLKAFERQSSSQIVVAIFQKLEQGAALEDFTYRTAESWGVGQDDKDNGAILFLFIADRKMRIEVGYGLEGAIPDITAKRIIQNEIRPALQSGDFDAGITAGVDALIQAARGEYIGTGAIASDSIRDKNEARNFIIKLLLFILLWWLLSKLNKNNGGGGGRVYTGGGTYTIGGGSWGGGSFGGGGFSGGGGGFGGGGASGGW